MSSRVFELRTYHTAPGALPALETRFRDHTTGLFERHGLDTVAFFTPEDRANTLVYLLTHESREAAKKSWAEFAADPEWKKVSSTPGFADAEIVSNITSVYLRPAAYSQI